MAQSNDDNPWKRAKKYKLLGRIIYVLKARDSDPREYYTELHRGNDTYLASMGSNMPFYWLAVLEALIRHRGEK